MNHFHIVWALALHHRRIINNWTLLQYVLPLLNVTITKIHSFMSHCEVLPQNNNLQLYMYYHRTIIINSTLLQHVFRGLGFVKAFHGCLCITSQIKWNCGQVQHSLPLEEHS